jgi:3-oxoacyl-[acyl-carrier protein] reductase
VAHDGFDLTGRVALLTGTGSGIGRATALTLAAAGATVVGADLDAAAAESTATGIREAGGRAEAHRLDVTDRPAVDALVADVVDRHGRLDIMGNIAGVPHNRLVTEVTDDELDRILAINAKSVFYGCRAAARVMVPQGYGVIVNVSSGAIDTPAPTLACYAMAKAAVAMLTRTLATEVGPAGVRVNALAPGVIETNFSRQHFVDEQGQVVPERLEAYRKRFGQMAPLRRVGTAQDVADAFWYLASDRAAFVTGQVLRPNGGVAMPW